MYQSLSGSLLLECQDLLFFLFYMIVNSISFRLLVGQNKPFKDVNLTDRPFHIVLQYLTCLNRNHTTHRMLHADRRSSHFMVAVKCQSEEPMCENSCFSRELCRLT